MATTCRKRPGPGQWCVMDDGAEVLVVARRFGGHVSVIGCRDHPREMYVACVHDSRLVACNVPYAPAWYMAHAHTSLDADVNWYTPTPLPPEALRPLSKAPRDGQRILLSIHGLLHIGEWCAHPYAHQRGGAGWYVDSVDWWPDREVWGRTVHNRADEDSIDGWLPLPVVAGEVAP
ncbi:hypothetical protein P7L78_22080 [Tistrella bauzanensis]|uniref:hypothetical protein n=1 Tax=Tistrella TaxID=171436 RepID=UPI0031F6F87D